MTSPLIIDPESRVAEDNALSWLIETNTVSSADVEQAISLSGSRDRSILLTLNQMGVLDDQRLGETLARVTGVEIAEAPKIEELESSPILNPDFMRTTKCLLLSKEGPLYVVNPIDPRPVRAAEFAVGAVPKVKILPAGDWLRTFQCLFLGDDPLDDLDGDSLELEAGLADQDRDAPIVRQVSTWLAHAAELAASDVHFDARRNAFDVQFRVDGLLRKVSTQSKSVSSAVIARIKVLADLDLGERNKPQDGRATIVVRGRKLDVRVSIVPTIDGESAVVRLLDRPGGVLSLNQLGFSESTRSKLKSIMHRRYGLFVVAGPTGSGKTTTLYACLETLKDRGLKILSVEDPVEYHFDHVNQVQVSDKAGRNFAGTLRAFLRHDPDVILVGEIRDRETAQTAVQAALSGHLVLATIHAIDTARVRTRLIDMGVEPFRLDACLSGALSQRLVRSLCDNCKAPIVPTSDQLVTFDRENVALPKQLYSPIGCQTCDGQGYIGRIVLSEFSTDEVIESDSDGLIAEALKMVVRGETSFQEIAGLIS